MADDRRPLAFGLTGVSALVALLAIAFRVSPNASTQASAPASAAARPPSTELAKVSSSQHAIDTFDRGRRLLSDFFGTPWEQRASWKTNVGVYNVNAVVATIPDPYDSHQDWFYDAYLESFRRAFAAAGYVPDRFWIPAREDSITLQQSGGPAERIAAHDYFPGVILFRQTNPVETPRRLWLLYIVFETPTAGIHKGAFKAAAAERNLVIGDPAFSVDALQQAELLVAGPVFSGSALSLRLALDDVLAPSPRMMARTARVISGSATASSNLAVIGDSTHVTIRVNMPAHSTAGAAGEQGTRSDSVVAHRIRYSSTVHTDDAMLKAARNVLHDLRIDEQYVALLSESSTQYGAAPKPPGRTDSAGTVFSNFLKNRSSRVPADRVRSDTPRATPPRVSQAPKSPAHQMLRIPFPLNIASLRSEFERTRSPSDQSPELPGFPSSPRTRLSLDERARPRESPAVVSDLTVPSLDLVMNEIFRVLRDHDIRAVIIQATDVRDKLTLAREIKRRLRSTQLLTFENHLLFLRPEFSQYLDGMYVVSSYPLFLENQWWSPREDAAYDKSQYRPLELLAFANDAGLGGYNALASLLSNSSSQLEYRDPFRETGLSEGRPPLWLTVIGRDAPYPVRIITTDSADRAHLQKRLSTSESGTVRPAPLRDAGLWTAVVWLCFAAVAALSWGVMWPAHFDRLRDKMLNTHPDEVLDRNTALHAVGDLPPESLEHDALLFSGVFVSAVQCAFLPAALIFAFATGSMLLAAASTALGVVGLAAGCWRLIVGNLGHLRLLFEHHHTRVPQRDDDAPVQIEALASPSDEPRNNHVGRLLIGMTGLLYVGLTIELCVAIARLVADTQAFAFFSFRTLHTWSGVSLLPALVLMGIGFALWSGWQLYQVRTAWNSRTPYEVALLQVACAGHLGLRGDDEEAILAVNESRKALLWLIPDRRIFFLAAALITFGILIIARRETVLDSLVLPSILGTTPVDWILWLGLFSLITTTSWGIARLFLAWKAVERALDTLAETPTLDAIRRLPKRARALSSVGLIGVPDAPKIAAVASEMVRRAQRAIMDLQADVKGASPEESEQITTLLDVAPQLPIQSELASAESERGATSRLSQGQRTVAVDTVFMALRELWPDPPPKTDAALLTSRAGRAQAFLEEYLATEALIFVHSTLRNFRWLALLLLAALIFLVVISSTYPLQPEGILKFGVVAVLLAATGTIVTVVMQMNRNDLLSVVAGTVPGKVSWDTTFALNLGLFAIIPLLAYLSTEFPSVRAFLFSWIEPTLKAMPNF